MGNDRHCQKFKVYINESSSWRLLMPLGMFCFAQKYYSVIEEVIRIMLCEFHTLINSITEEEETEVYCG